MVFSAPIFLYGFLPLCLLVYYLSPKLLKNSVLLLFSLLFYAWGEMFYVGVISASIIGNYFFGFLVAKSHASTGKTIPPKIAIWLALGFNLLLLISFKYANFIADNVNSVFTKLSLDTIDLAPVHLPLGISFFTFQAISYQVDIYRRQVPPQRNFLNFALYISLFPQLIAGPIVRYKDIAEQILHRETSVDLFTRGAQRFTFGLAKKVLIANSVGQTADLIFAMSTNEITAPLAWIGVIAYTIQIYFDFSGYSDMAIGLGMMFGFRFLENFDYPYISTSIREFWRRWHISLSTWFRDYVYIALGGNKVSPWRVYLNLMLVFILTGLWHGASWNFLIWGLFHGSFILLERLGLSTILQRAWRPIGHLYMHVVLLVGWAFFNFDTLPQSLQYIHAMFDLGNFTTSELQYALIFTHENLLALFIGILFSMPLYPAILRWGTQYKNHILMPYGNLALVSGLFYLSCVKLASSTYDPFIYFRF